jgi:hypothetical protein
MLKKDTENSNQRFATPTQKKEHNSWLEDALTLFQNSQKLSTYDCHQTWT